MTVEIRPITADEYPRFDENVRLGFSTPARTPAEAERPPWVTPEQTLCAFEDGELATTYAALPLQMHLHGGVVPVHGVTAVTTLPWQRRRGHLRRIMEIDFRRQHEQGGPPIAALYASMAAIYQRFGYAIVSTFLQYRIEPRYIEFTEPWPERGRFRTFAKEEWPSVAPLYEEFATGRSGYLRRGTWDWERLTWDDWGPDVQLIAVAYEENGETTGYLLYFARNQRRESGPVDFGGTVVAWVADFVWHTASAYRALWGYLRRIDLAKQIILLRSPVDDPAPHLFLEPRQLYVSHSDGLLARIIDVDRAAAARRYSAEGRVTFEIEDEIAPWNAGRWELEAGGEGAAVRRTDRTPQLTMPVATLAPLLFGHFNASQAARMGRLSADDPDALRHWDALLRTDLPPGSMNGF